MRMGIKRERRDARGRAGPSRRRRLGPPVRRLEAEGRERLKPEVELLRRAEPSRGHVQAVVEVRVDLGGVPEVHRLVAGEILADLLPLNITVQIFKALLENAASEQGARMSAMDNATRNAGDMIGRLTLNYNRTRQAMITKELIEIISGAEAL